jgi:hypothetical protein
VRGDLALAKADSDTPTLLVTTASTQANPAINDARFVPVDTIVCSSPFVVMGRAGTLLVGRRIARAISGSPPLLSVKEVAFPLGLQRLLSVDPVKAGSRWVDMVRKMADLKLDVDVSEAVESGVASIADPAERERVSNFLDAVNASRSDPGVERLEAVAVAGKKAYESRTAELHLGWQKVILVETGLAGERLEHYNSQRSYEVMKWSYDHCKKLGYSIDDVDEGTPMGEYMYNINLAIIANMPPPTLQPTAGSASGAAAASGSGCLIAILSAVATFARARR